MGSFSVVVEFGVHRREEDGVLLEAWRMDPSIHQCGAVERVRVLYLLENDVTCLHIFDIIWWWCV